MKLFWWHCSDVPLGERFVAKLRAPIIRGTKEPLTPRICVARTVAACFTAVLFRGGPVYAYRTVRRLSGVKPVGVFDQVATGEKWLVHPAEFELDRCILPGSVLRSQQATVLFHRETRKGSSLILKVCQRAIAVRVLGGPDWEQRLCDRWLKSLKIGDPEEYILRCAVGNVSVLEYGI